MIKSCSSSIIVFAGVHVWYTIDISFGETFSMVYRWTLYNITEILLRCNTPGFWSDLKRSRFAQKPKCYAF